MSDLTAVLSRPGGAGAPLEGTAAADVWAWIAAQHEHGLLAVDAELRVLVCNEAARALYRRLLGIELRTGEEPGLGEVAASGLQHGTREQWARAVAGESFATVGSVPGSGGGEEVLEWRFLPLREPGARGSAPRGAVCELRREVAPVAGELERQVGERTSQLIGTLKELERRKAEAEVQRERLRTVLNALPVGVWIADQDGKLVARNQAARDIWGEDAPMSERTEDYGKDYRAWWPDGRALTSEDWALARAIRLGEVSADEEIEIQGWDGRRRVVLNYAQPIRGADGAITGGVAVNIDITERRAGELALLESARTVRQQLAEIEAIYDGAPVGLAVFDRELRFVRINERLAQINGIAREAHLGRTLRELLPALAEVAEPLLRRVLESGEPLRNVEFSGETPAQPGVVRYWLENFHPLRQPGGEVTGLTVTAQEITERRRVELARQFLGEASRVLASSLDYETTLAQTARLTIPFLADYCLLDIVQDDGATARVAGAHVDPALEPLLREVMRYSASDLGDGVVPRVLRSGVAELIAEPSAAILERDAGGAGEFLELVQQLGPCSYMCVPMQAGGRVVGSILLCYSVSGRRHGLAELEVAQELGRRAGAAVFNAHQYYEAERARRAAESASRSKSQFLATMSHELRTPLTGIIGYAELLTEEVPGPLNARQQHQLGRIKSSAWHLVTIIDEILLFARVEAGREQLRLTEFDLGALVQESVGIVEPQAHAKGVVLAVSLPAGPLAAESDQGKLRQVLLNLVGNAIKFTDEGFVRVELTVGGGAAEIRVQDTGPGVPEDERQRIFEPFTQVDGSNTRQKGGTGLGLTVSRQLAQMLDGNLELEATSPAGSTFLLTIPLRPGRRRS